MKKVQTLALAMMKVTPWRETDIPSIFTRRSALNLKRKDSRKNVEGNNKPKRRNKSLDNLIEVMKYIKTNHII